MLTLRKALSLKIEELHEIHGRIENGRVVDKRGLDAWFQSSVR